MTNIKRILSALKSFLFETGEVTYADLYPTPKASRTGVVTYADYYRHDLHTGRGF